MAFNFNWSPLIADTSRARDMLTAALNKSPKPPIIVDDIIVTELNLGSVPPKLDILEIGDLAVDRFRGIFKMEYSGDAFLTLKTKVQANPLNTYLSTRPSFASPQPLAASSGLTIPLQITLSDIKLSGFVILVFSKQKGITLVFRNDPLESLKVSSTFDSVAFIRDYLQRQIEKQLRQLFMEDLPVIIHRLSLRVWPGPDQLAEVNSNISRLAPTTDGLSDPSQRSLDGTDEEFEPFSLDSIEGEANSSFSQKNMLRLAALTDSHRTLSLFTPPVKDVVFRAWASSAERASHSKPTAPQPASFTTLTTLASSPARPTTATATETSSQSSYISESGPPSIASAPARPSLQTSSSSYTSTSYTPSMLSRPRTATRKRKNRVVNLRKSRETTPAEDLGGGDGASIITSSERPSTPTSSAPGSSTSDHNQHLALPPREGEIDTAPNSPEKQPVYPDPGDLTLRRPKTHRRPRISDAPAEHFLPAAAVTNSSVNAAMAEATGVDLSARPIEYPNPMETAHPAFTYRMRPGHRPFATSASGSGSAASVASAPEPGSAVADGSILEHAWMAKMADEIARKVAAERAAAAAGEGSSQKSPSAVEDTEYHGEDAPPAYSLGP